MEHGVLVDLHFRLWGPGGHRTQVGVSGSFQDFTEDVNCAFEFLLKLTPLLDKADQRCKYETPAHPFY